MKGARPTTNESERFFDYDDYLWSLNISHVPLRPPRTGFIGECVYAEEWKRLMKQPLEYGPHAPHQRLAYILGDLPVWITQRHATIAASLICWLGTNCGQCVILTGKRLAKDSHLGAEAAYLAAWTMQGRRHRGVNHGVRTLEHLLAPEDHHGFHWLTGLHGLVRIPELSAEDYETAEYVAAWLGSDDGQAFILRCERRIKELQDLEHAQRRLRHEQEIAGLRGIG